MWSDGFHPHENLFGDFWWRLETEAFRLRCRYILTTRDLEAGETLQTYVHSQVIAWNATCLDDQGIASRRFIRHTQDYLEHAHQSWRQTSGEDRGCLATDGCAYWNNGIRRWVRRCFNSSGPGRFSCT